jgi:hypothetical protein
MENHNSKSFYFFMLKFGEITPPPPQILIGTCRKHDNIPYEDVPKSNYRPYLKHKSLIMILYFFLLI